MLKELSEIEFKSTFDTPMNDVTESAEPVVDIWPYINELVKNSIVEQYVFDKNLVECVYRNDSCTFDHILLPTKYPGTFITLVVDIINKTVYGFFKLDLKKEYGIL